MKWSTAVLTIAMAVPLGCGAMQDPDGRAAPQVQGTIPTQTGRLRTDRRVEPEGAAAKRGVSSTAGRSAANARPAPIGPTESFETAPNLLAFASVAAASTEPARMVQGFQAASICIAARSDWDFISPHLLGSREEAATAVRRHSAEVLRSRCEGFINGDRVANHTIRTRIRQQAASNPEVYLGGTADPPISRAQFEHALRAQDRATAAMAASEVVPGMLRSHKLDERNADAPLLALAYLASLCEIGRDCGPDRSPTTSVARASAIARDH